MELLRTRDGRQESVAITGFATTFEIHQSHDPPSVSIDFRVPYLPEGFRYAAVLAKSPIREQRGVLGSEGGEPGIIASRGGGEPS